MKQPEFEYDYLIVGSGLFGSVFARELTDKNLRCLIIEKRNHVGGNCYSENMEGINVHKYGPHIFHTNDKKIWDYVNSFANFNRFTYMPIADYRGERYNLPFNMNTFYQLWKLKTPAEAYNKIKEQAGHFNLDRPKNLEEHAISIVGYEIYGKLIKEYTEKQWGRKATDLPSSIIKRIKLRFTYDNNYFDDKFQGVPIGGYDKLLGSILKGIEVRLNTDYFLNRDYWHSKAKTVVFTGRIDEYFDFCLGELEYRGLHFETQRLEMENYQGNAVVNYTGNEVPYTRITEHKHFEFGRQPFTIITKEYPKAWKTGDESFYPVNDSKNQALHKQYRELSRSLTNVVFGGRLAEYKYYDMHEVIASALHTASKVFIKNHMQQF